MRKLQAEIEKKLTLRNSFGCKPCCSLRQTFQDQERPSPLNKTTHAPELRKSEIAGDGGFGQRPRRITQGAKKHPRRSYLPPPPPPTDWRVNTPWLAAWAAMIDRCNVTAEMPTSPG